jgi:exo-beta-1,3-glucanase (GH17 family)
MHYPVGLFTLVAAAIAGTWWWLGAAAPMPASPLAPGEKLYCVSYAPFRGQQSPLDLTIQIDARQIEEDMGRLRSVTDCVRTYSTRNGLHQVPDIAARHGIKVMQGIWLGGDPAAAERDLETAVGLAQRLPDTIGSVVVGNEVLLRGEMTPNDLAATIRRVKAAIRQPVTYADVWEFWLRFPALYDVVDFVTIHILPYWEDFPIGAGSAAAHLESIRRKVAAAYPAKEILIGETGWPSAGRMRESALPSPVSQARVLHDTLRIAKQQGYHVNLIEAFDQPWKRRLEGTVGGHWGLLDAERRAPKFAWGDPVSDHPHWRTQAAAGIALAALIFAAGFAARRRVKDRSPRFWPGVAAIALAPGMLIGWAIENVPLESLTVGDWLRSLVMAGLAAGVPLLAAVALARGQGVPAFARVLGPAEVRTYGRLARALGLMLIALSVVAVQVAFGLVFDPRYKDFPFAPLTAAAVPVLILMLVGKPGGGRRGAAELAFAAVLTVSAVYIVLNESFANWQALWLAAVLVSLAATLLLVRDAPG